MNAYEPNDTRFLPLFDEDPATIPIGVAGLLAPAPQFDGATYEAEHDHARLTKQAKRVFDVLLCGEWLTIAEIAERTGDMHQSVSARIRDFRKDKFGGYRVDRRRRGQAAKGIHEYQLVTPENKA